MKFNTFDDENIAELPDYDDFRIEKFEESLEKAIINIVDQGKVIFKIDTFLVEQKFYKKINYFYKLKKQ